MSRPRISVDACDPAYQHAMQEDVVLTIDHGNGRVVQHLCSWEAEELIVKLSQAVSKARVQQGRQDVIRERS